MQNIVGRFGQDRAGTTAVEYALLIAVLSLVIVGGVGSLGNEMAGMFAGHDRALQGAFSSTP